MKHFSSLWRKLTAALCGVAIISMSLVSCAEAYDDTYVNERIDNLEKRVAELERQMSEQIDNLSVIAAMQDAISKLESAVSANDTEIAELVAAITGIRESINEINGDITNINGNIATTAEQIAQVIADYKAGDLKLEDAIAKLGMGIVTVVPNEETGMYDIVLSDGTQISVLAQNDAIKAVEVKEYNGTLYWAIDGEFLTDEEGNYVPVYKAPQIRIGDTGQLQVSIDGVNWVDTGVAFNTDGSVAPSFFSGVEYDDEYAIFTMLDGTELKVALVPAEPLPTMDVAFEKNKFFFAAGETKNVGLTMANVKKYIVVKPEGWKAVVAKDQKSIAVTAPAEGAGETEGFVQLFTVSEDGKSAITELKVQVGEPNLALEINEDGTYSIKISEQAKADLEAGLWAGYLMYATPMYEGLTLEAIYEQIAGNYNPYWATIYDKDIEDTFGDLEPGVPYAVCAVEIVAPESGIMFEAVPAPFEDMYYTTFTKVVYEVTAGESTVADIEFEITSAGLSAGLYAVPYYYDPTSSSAEEEIEYIISEMSWQIEEGYMEPLEGGQFSGTWKELYNLVNGYNHNCQPDTKYMVAIIPGDNITVEAVKYAEGQVKDIVLGETKADVTFSEPEIDFTTISTIVTPNEDCYVFRYIWVDAATYATYADDAAKLKKILDSYGQCFEEDEAYKGGAQPGEDWYLMVAASEANGNTKVITKMFSTTALTYNTTDTVTVTIDETKVELEKATMAVTASAGVKKLRYIIINDATYTSPYYQWSTDADYPNKVLGLNTNYNIKEVELSENGEYLLEDLEVFTKMHVFVAGVDADGLITKSSYAVADTSAPFKKNWGGVANITVKDVLYWFNEDYYSYNEAADAVAEWTSISSFKSIDEMNGLRGFVKLDVDWGTHKPKTVWLWHGRIEELVLDDPTTEGEDETDHRGNSMNMIKKRAASYYASTVPYQISQGLCYLREADYGYDEATDTWGTIYGPQTLNMAFQDEDGKYYGLTTIVIDDFVGGAAAE